MFTLISRSIQQVIKAISHQWDTLVKKTGRQTANVLLAYIALGVVFEMMWLTILISIFVLAYILN